MAKVYLDSGDTFALSGAASVYGSTGTEKVIVNTGVTGVVVDANVERVDLPGASTAYTYQQSGNQLKVMSGTTVVATIPLQEDTDGTQVVFSNGSVSAKVGATGMTLGGATVPSAAAAAVTPTTIDATVTSGSGTGTGTGTGQTFSLTTATETKALTTGNDTVDGATVANSADGDNIVDSLNTDSDVANITLTKAPTTGPVFANVEKINLALNYFDPSFDASKVTNGTIVVSTAQEGNSKATFTGVGTNGVKFEVGTGVTNLTLNGTSSASDSTSIKLAGGTSTLSVGATTLIETVALNSAGSAANVVTLTNSASAETFSVTGSQDLTLKATAANLAGDTLTKALDSGKTVTVQLTTTLASTADLKAVAADSFNTSSTATALGANTLTFAAGTTNLTINGADQLDNAASVLAATGTGTTDVLNLTLAADQANVDTSSFETVNLNYTGSTVDLSLATLKGGAVTSAVSKYVLTGARNVTLTSVTGKSVDLSGLTGTATATVTSANTTSGISVTTTGNADTINLGSLITGKGTVVAGAGNDTITGGAGDDSINAGAGNDSIAASAGNDSVDGGDGNDIINTGAGSNFVLGGAGDDTINLTTGTDAVVAGTGNDTVVVSGANLTSADTLVGGDGTDTLSITTAGTVATALDNVSGFENISFATNIGAIAVTAVDSLIANGTTLTVDVAIPNGIVTWNGAAETDGNLKLTIAASNFAHTVKGGAGADTITIGASTTPVSVEGGAGADTISVTGAAAHVVKGGAGADTIDLGTASVGVVQLATITDSTTGSFDSISNYTTGTTAVADKIDLSAITNFTTTLASNVTASVSVGGIATGLYTASTSGAFTSLADAITRVGADVKTAGTAVVFGYGSDSYVFVDTDGAATTSNDILVKLVGVPAVAGVTTAAVNSSVFQILS